MRFKLAVAIFETILEFQFKPIIIVAVVINEITGFTLTIVQLCLCKPSFQPLSGKQTKSAIRGIDDYSLFVKYGRRAEGNF